MSKQQSIKLTAHSTVGYDEEPPYTLRVYIRDEPEVVRAVYELDHEFEERWQAGKTRHAVLAAGEIDPAKWKESDSNYTPPAF